ncbi:MAG: XdhC family protein [Deltaproteobacteria bacterium]|nr:XdhC family protein [Deltaproteobacteria bacterium]
MTNNIFLQVDKFLSRGKRVVLARIVARKGSTPRAIGSKCIITEDGTLVGTIGGGFVEHVVLEQAKDVFREKKSHIHHFELTGEDLSRADMLCGGVLDVYLDPIFPENKDTIDLFRTVTELIETGLGGTFLTLVSEGASALDTGNRMLIKIDGSTQGEIPELMGSLERLSLADKPSLIEFPELEFQVFVESIELDPVLLLFGAGHVSAFVARLAKMVGFQVVVIDDRAEYANEERFPQADEIHVLPFPRAFEPFQVTPDSYITILTRGHTSDRIVLKSVLQTDPAYIGMIGSLKKRNTIYQALMEEGIPREKLDRVCSPIGIEINAETPEEIAVSIVAELIKTRAKRAGEKMTPSLVVKPKI